MRPSEGSTDPSQCPRPWGDSPAPGGLRPPLIDEGEAALCLRSSEMGLSLQEEPAGQAPATLGQVIHLPNRCPRWETGSVHIRWDWAVPGAGVSGNQGPCDKAALPSLPSCALFSILSFSFLVFKHPSAWPQDPGADGHLWRHGWASGCRWEGGGHGGSLPPTHIHTCSARTH